MKHVLPIFVLLPWASIKTMLSVSNINYMITILLESKNVWYKSNTKSQQVLRTYNHNFILLIIYIYSWNCWFSLRFGWEKRHKIRTSAIQYVFSHDMGTYITEGRSYHNCTFVLLQTFTNIQYLYQDIGQKQYYQMMATSA